MLFHLALMFVRSSGLSFNRLNMLNFYQNQSDLKVIHSEPKMNMFRAIIKSNWKQIRSLLDQNLIGTR